MKALGRSARSPASVYLTGGSTAVLFGWREKTVDIDVRFIPELDELFRAIAELKETLDVNIELASPPDFIPEVPGWEERSIFIAREGKIDFYHFDPYSQALAKIERGHAQDVLDIEQMFSKKLIDPERLVWLYEAIEPWLFRYPALSPIRFRQSVNEAVRKQKRGT